MTTEKDLCSTCGHPKGSHTGDKNYVGRCRRKVFGRLCTCKKFISSKQEVQK